MDIADLYKKSMRSFLWKYPGLISCRSTNFGTVHRAATTHGYVEIADENGPSGRVITFTNGDFSGYTGVMRLVPVEGGSLGHEEWEFRAMHDGQRMHI